MTRHQRLHKSLRSPVRYHKQKKNRYTRRLRRAVNAAFEKVIRAPYFPNGIPPLPAQPTPQQRFRALQKAARRQRRGAS